MTVSTIRLATSRHWKDRQTGQKREETEWHRVVFFDRMAEIIKDYVSKGQQIYVEGRLQTRKWQGQDGQDRYSTEIVAEEMHMLGARKQGDTDTYSPPNQQNSVRSDTVHKNESDGGWLEGEDDIPF